MQIDDIKFDRSGRLIIFIIKNITIVNAYPKAGTDASSRQEREDFFNITIPNIMLQHKSNLILGGDWNCITENKDCAHFPDQKNPLP